MSSHYRLQKVLLYAVLQFTALLGAPLLPEDIDDLMKTMRRTVVEDSNPDDSDHPKALLPPALVNGNPSAVCLRMESEARSL